MERGTMEYIARRTDRENRRRNESDNRRNNDNDGRNDGRNDRRNEYPEYENGRISSRYSIGNTYRIENHGSTNQQEPNQIGFIRNENYGGKNKDFLYEMEESLENEIDDIVYYSEMAIEADSKGHMEFSHAFYEIAKEKMTCAEFIRLRLIKLDAYDPSKQKDIEERYDRAKHLFKRL